MSQARTKKEVEDGIIELCAQYANDPLSWVLMAFPWDTDPELQICELPEPWASKYGLKYGPDKWACEYLEYLGEQARNNGFNGKDPVEPIQIAVTSGHGIGKSFLTSMLILWIMSTRPHCKGTVTANTSDQLRTKTWGELGKWHKRCLTSHWFEYNNSKGNMVIYHKEDPESWRCDAQTCREENSESFAGQHRATSTSFYVFDEASAVPSKIFEVAKGGLTDGEPMMFLFGNPTRNTGEFRECWRQNRHRWKTFQVDSRDVQITNKKEIQKWVDDNGDDSDFVRVRVRGVFPKQSAKQFISEADADAAYGRPVMPGQFESMPVILGVDPAWTGDDEFVIIKRQGILTEVLGVYQFNDNDGQMANIIARFQDEHRADAVFIDMGYGTGIYSIGQMMGRSWQLISFGAKSPDDGYYLQRSYMWGMMKQWLKAGGSISKEQQLYQDLIGPETVPRIDGKIALEPKEAMKKRGLPSPNYGDALALTFAMPVVKITEDTQGMANQWSDTSCGGSANWEPSY